MKANIFFRTLLSMSFVLLVSFTSIANTATNYTSYLTKNLSAINNETSAIVASQSNDFDFSYLRFDVTKYTGDNDIIEAPSNSFDYLRFDVNNYINTNSTVMLEMPIINEFGYLRFYLNKFTVDEALEISELPVYKFDYLRFDVKTYKDSDNFEMNILPVND